MSMCEIGGEKDVEDAQNADSGRRSWRLLGGVAGLRMLEEMLWKLFDSVREARGSFDAANIKVTAE